VIACRRCGTDNPDNEAVCTACGVRLDDTAARALIGTLVLGAYEIVDVLGQGGMSVVYKARHKLTDQIVALKISRGFYSVPIVWAAVSMTLTALVAALKAAGDFAADVRKSGKS